MKDYPKGLQSRRVLSTRTVPEVENFDELLFRYQVVVDMKRRMKKSKYARISLLREIPNGESS